MALAAMVGTAQASVYCTGTISDHLVYNDGTLTIRASFRADWVSLCNLQTPWKGVSTEACFTWVGLITAARTHNKFVGIYYDGDVPCGSIPGYTGAPGPVYVRMTE